MVIHFIPFSVPAFPHFGTQGSAGAYPSRQLVFIFSHIYRLCVVDLFEGQHNQSDTELTAQIKDVYMLTSISEYTRIY